MRILIAEDDITSRTVLSAVLQKNGHEPVEARDGAEALASLLREDAPRMAILDWMMPEIDGVEVCRRVRAREQERPPYLIMLTTRGEKTDVSTGLRAGANDYIAKPFNAVELVARIEVGCRYVALEDRYAAKVRELEEALAQIKTLSGVVPICSHCKKIRDDEGYWNQFEAFVASHTEARVTHGICPVCMAKLYPEYVDEPGEAETRKRPGATGPESR